jgi:hypothetical protein
MNANTSRMYQIRELGAQEINQVRELQEHELDAVTGGLVVIAIIAILISPLLPTRPATSTAGCGCQ